MSDRQKFLLRDWLVGVATTVALSVSGTAALMLINVDRRVAVIENTRFTADDAKEQIEQMHTLIINKLEHMQSDLDRIESQTKR